MSFEAEDTNLGKESPLNEIPQETISDQPTVNNPVDVPVQEVQEFLHPENFIAGVVGAFLFSLIGCLLYFFVYQLGYIAGICGLVIFVLANFGYQLFSGRKNSKKGVITAVIISVIAILLAEGFCVSYMIYDILKDSYIITLFEVIRAMPNLLKQQPDIVSSVVKDLLFAFAFGALASFAPIKNALRVSRGEQPISSNTFFRKNH